MGCDPIFMLVLVLVNGRVRVEFPNPKAASTTAFSFHVGALDILSHGQRIVNMLTRVVNTELCTSLTCGLLYFRAPHVQCPLTMPTCIGQGTGHRS